VISKNAKRFKKAKYKKKKRNQFATPQPDLAKSNTIISKRNISITLANLLEDSWFKIAALNEKKSYYFIISNDYIINFFFQ